MRLALTIVPDDYTGLRDIRRRSHHKIKGHSCQTKAGNSERNSAQRSCWTKAALPRHQMWSSDVARLKHHTTRTRQLSRADRNVT